MVSISIFCAASLLAALPQAIAQKPSQISINVGPPVAAITPGVLPPGGALAGTGIPARPIGTTYTINMGAGAPNATGIAAPQQSRTPGAQQVWVIRVGSTNGSLAFSPNTITGAQVGDQIQFQFYPRNHSVVMGDYANPCSPIASNNPQAFFSGFMPTTTDGQITYTVPVRSTEPMWMYCSQARHCQEGMVAVVNPPATGQTLQDYQQRAAQAQQNISPAGQIGGTTPGQPGQPGATPISPTTATPAQATNPNSATSNIRTTSWTLAAVAAYAIFLL